MATVRDFLEQHVLKRTEVDVFLDSDSPNWAGFDPELGYTLRTCSVQDGVDGSFTLGSYVPGGERRTMNYAEKPCRINAYGNSYTQCHQVSDAETWEEYLAGHLGEPIRNFGVGGYGIYQAWRRLKRTELSDKGVEYVIFNLFGIDDHFRSLDKWRRPRCGNWFEVNPPTLFHANPWDYVRIEPGTGELVEHRNLCPTPQSLYNLCDRDFVFEHFERDLMINIFLGQQPAYDIHTDGIMMLADTLNVSVDLEDREQRAIDLAHLHRTAGLHATCRIVRWARDFIEEQDKKMLLLLSYGDWNIREACEGNPRFDQKLIDFLDESALPYVDLLEKHVRDYRDFGLSPQQYVDRYCIPHYNPAGNHFVAYAIKDDVVCWLNPRPATYPRDGETMRFDDYLPSGRD